MKSKKLDSEVCIRAALKRVKAKTAKAEVDELHGTTVSIYGYNSDDSGQVLAVIDLLKFCKKRAPMTNIGRKVAKLIRTSR